MHSRNFLGKCSCKSAGSIAPTSGYLWRTLRRSADRSSSRTGQMGTPWVKVSVSPLIIHRMCQTHDQQVHSSPCLPYSCSNHRKGRQVKGTPHWALSHFFLRSCPHSFKKVWNKRIQGCHMIACSLVNDKVKDCLGHLIIIAASGTKHENIRTLAQYKWQNTDLSQL